MGVLLGFDPGGAGAFGWCIVEDADQPPLRVLSCGVARHAKDALHSVLTHLPAEMDVRAAGIDAPLFWTASGNRVADKTVRSDIKKCGAPFAEGTVQAVNSLRGACLVQGMMLGVLLRNQWRELSITVLMGGLCGTAVACGGGTRPGEETTTSIVARSTGVGLFPLSVDGKYGYMNRSGRVVVEPQWDWASEFSEGLAKIMTQDENGNNSKYGYMDTTGQIVVPLQFSEAHDFSEGLAAVALGSPFGYIDKTGKMVIENRFNGASSFSEGRAGVVIYGEGGMVSSTRRAST